MSNSENNVPDNAITFKDLIKLLKLSFVRIVVFALILTILTGSITLLVMLAPDKENIFETRIEYTHQEAERGLNPFGGNLDINEIKSEKIIESALKEMGFSETRISTLKVEIKENLSVTGVLPREASQKYFTIQSLPNNQAAIADFLALSYYPTQYLISFNATKSLKMTKAESIKFLNALVREYQISFRENFDYIDIFSFVVNNLVDIENMDYIKIFDLLHSQMTAINTFLLEKAEESPRFRASTSQMTFFDTYIKFSTITSNIKQIELLVTKNGLEKDGEEFEAVKAQDYISDKITQLASEINSLEQSIERSGELIKTIKTQYILATPEGTFEKFPEDSVLMEEIHKLLITALSEDEKLLASCKKEYDAWKVRGVQFGLPYTTEDGTKIEKVDITPTQERAAIKSVDSLIASVSEDIAEAIESLRATVAEYVETDLNYNKVNQIFPPAKRGSDSFSMNIFLIVLFLSAFIGAIAAIGITYYKNNSSENKAKAKEKEKTLKE